MKKLIALAGLAAVLLLTGCDQSGFVFNRAEVQSGVVQVDSVQLPDGSLVAVTPEMRGLIDPAKIIKAGSPIIAEQVTVNPAVQTAVKAVSYLPIPFADVVSYGLNGLLGIAAVWLTKKKRTSEKVNASLVKGVDTFRDILDQTEVGGKLDEHLVKTLREQQEKDGVRAVVNFLLDRYMTPAKPPHSALTAAALKS